MTKTKTTSTASKAKTYSEPVLAIVKILKENPNKPMSFAEITSLAGVENKSGYLASVRKILGDKFVVDKDAIETEVKVKRKVNAYTYEGSADGEFDTEDTSEDASDADETELAK